MSSWQTEDAPHGRALDEGAYSSALVVWVAACPFCGGTLARPATFRGRYRVACRCGAGGPVRMDPASAATAWNLGAFRLRAEPVRIWGRRPVFEPGDGAGDVSWSPDGWPRVVASSEDVRAVSQDNCRARLAWLEQWPAFCGDDPPPAVLRKLKRKPRRAKEKGR